jgi:hypothetical protein
MTTARARRRAALADQAPTPPIILPPLVAYLVAVVSAVVGLLVSLGIVDNDLEKLIGGLAAILIPAAYVIANAIIHHGASKERAALIAASAGRVPVPR